MCQTSFNLYNSILNISDVELKAVNTVCPPPLFYCDLLKEIEFLVIFSLYKPFKCILSKIKFTKQALMQMSETKCNYCFLNIFGDKI